MLLRQVRWELFFISTIKGSDKKPGEWRDKRLKIFLENENVIESIATSDDEEMEKKLRQHVKNETLDEFYKKHRERKAA